MGKLVYTPGDDLRGQRTYVSLDSAGSSDSVKLDLDKTILKQDSHPQPDNLVTRVLAMADQDIECEFAGVHESGSPNHQLAVFGPLYLLIFVEGKHTLQIEALNPVILNSRSNGNYNGFGASLLKVGSHPYLVSQRNGDDNLLSIAVNTERVNAFLGEQHLKLPRRKKDILIIDYSKNRRRLFFAPSVTTFSGFTSPYVSGVAYLGFPYVSLPRYKETTIYASPDEMPFGRFVLNPADNSVVLGMRKR